MTRRLLACFVVSSFVPMASGQYALSLPRTDVCAGSVVKVGYTAPRNHSLQNAVVMSLGPSQWFVQELKVPAGAQGTLSFATSRTQQGAQLWFNYVDSLLNLNPLASAGPFVLEDPADSCGVCGYVLLQHASFCHARAPLTLDGACAEAMTALAKAATVSPTAE
jgi:hypothetical protein